MIALECWRRNQETRELSVWTMLSWVGSLVFSFGWMEASWILFMLVEVMEFCADGLQLT